MARIRTIKPEFWTDAKTGTLTEVSKCLLLGLLNHSDDYGVLEFSPMEWRAKILPYHSDTTTGTVQNSLVEELLPRGLVQIFSYAPNDDDPKQYLFITNFAKHQVINKPSKPIIAGWKLGDNPITYAARAKIDYRELSDPIPNHSTTTTGGLLPGKERKGKEGKGKEAEGNGEEAREQVLASPEPEIEPLPVSKTKNPKPQVLRGTRWHPDNIIPDEWIDAANAAREKAGSAPVDMRHEVVKFSHYWASPDARNPLKKDWRQTFINWILNSKGKQDGKQSTVVDSVNALMGLGRKADPVDDIF